MMWDSILSLVYLFAKGVAELLNFAKKYERKKKIRDRTIRALRDEAQNFLNLIEQFNDKSEEQISFIDLVTKDPSSSNINRLINGLSQLYFIYSKIIEAFIKLARCCNEIMSCEPFIKELEESDKDLYAFIYWVGRAYDSEKDQIKFDRKFYRFIKLYEDRFFEKTKEYEIEKITCAIEDIKQKMPTLKFWISKKKRSIRKGVKRNLDKSLKSLDNVSAKIVIEDLDIAEIKDYIPTKFRPIATLFEEISSSIQ